MRRSPPVNQAAGSESLHLPGFAVPAALVDAPVALTSDAIRQVLTGQVFAVFIVAVAAAEVTLGLALAVAIYRRRETAEVTDLTSARG